MKKSIALLSALLMGLSYCPSGTVAMAMEDSKTSLEDENLLVDEALAEKDESLSVDQALAEKDESLSADEALPEKDESLSADEALPEKSKNSSTDQAPLDNERTFAERLWKKITDNTGEIEGKQTGTENETQQETENREPETAAAQASGLKNLQIPQRLGVVIDPWEMDGKGQVYSEVYVIRNTGDTPGVLTLSNLACRPQEQSGVIVKTDKDGLHDSDNKYIYMEMLFGNGDQIIFSTEKSQYQTELKPGEELSVCFTGEVNENAFAKWMDQDVAISVVYSWEAGAVSDGSNLEGLKEDQKNIANEEESADHQQADVNGEEPADRQQAEASGEETTDQQTDTSGEESADIPQTDPSIENAEDEQEGDPGEKKQESNLQEEADKEPVDIPQTGADQESAIREESPDAVNDDIQQESPANINIENEKESEIIYNTEEGQTDGNSEIAVEDLQTAEGTVRPDEKEKEEIKNIELQEPKKSDIKIESWKIDEKGRIVSPEYLLYNAGDTTGTWTLSELICKPQEPGEVRVTKNNKDMNDSEEKSVYMELVSGSGEKVILSQEGSTYRVKLEPGEKMAVRFIGEMKGNLFESREEGDIAVTAVCSWDRD